MGRNLTIGPADMARFWAKVEKTDTCWLWTGRQAPDGYGTFWGRVTTHVHRFAYITLRGPIPLGMQVDHLCKVRHCVNPDHLEAVSPRENTRRSAGAPAANVLKTHCPRGHEYDLVNTYVDRRGRRSCRACNTENWRRRRESGRFALAEEGNCA